MNVYDKFEHAGLIVEIIQDDEPGTNPQENDNAGTIYSWTRDFDGDERISEPDLLIDESTDWNEDPRYRAVSLSEWFALEYDAALTIPLRFSDYGGSGARIYRTNAENANCAICFTEEEMEREWPVSADRPTESPADGARVYAEARINELDEYLQGYVFGIVVREPGSSLNQAMARGEVLESIWGFIGDPSGKSGEYMLSEAREMAESCAKAVQHEAELREEAAARDIMTVDC